MGEPKFQIGDDIFVRDPGRYVEGARSLTGVIGRITSGSSGFKYEFVVDKIAINTGPGHFDFYWADGCRLTINETDLGHRTGTPLSELSLGNGRTTERFKEIGRSWGYP